MASKQQLQPGPVPTDSILEQARTLVLLWDRAEDWAVPRIPPSQIRVLTVLARERRTNLTTLARELGAKRRRTVPGAVVHLVAAVEQHHREKGCGSV